VLAENDLYCGDLVGLHWRVLLARGTPGQMVELIEWINLVNISTAAWGSASPSAAAPPIDSFLRRRRRVQEPDLDLV
jgi:hypothetical protein